MYFYNKMEITKKKKIKKKYIYKKKYNTVGTVPKFKTYQIY